MDKPVILCVDDEKMILSSLKDQLKRDFGSEYNIETVESGEEALEVVDELIEDTVDMPIVVADQIMPGMKGHELLREIHARLPKTLKIMLTGQANADAVGNAVNHAKLYRYISKPWDPTDLTMTITEALRSYSQDKQLALQNTALQKMNADLEDLNTAYERFVPREFLSFLQKGSILDVALGDQVQQEMTVLFSDIRGFTSLSERMTPEENFQFINAYLGQMVPVIREHHGVIDKFIGDAIMAIFHGRADDAVDAGITMLRALDSLNQTRQAVGQPPLRIGIGMNTGSLMLGIIGEHGRMSGTVISDAVNTASRLEGLTKIFGASFLISEYTLRLLEHPERYYARFLGKLQVKGKRSAVAVFEIFNGESAAEIALKMQTKVIFEKGLQDYFAKDFAEAAVQFKNVLKEHPTDISARLYLERSARLMVQGVPAEWQGIETIEY